MSVLEVEDEDHRQRRIQSVLEKLNSTSPVKADQKLNFDFHQQVKSNPSELLSRVQAFLPQLEASNAILAQADPKSVDIENIQKDGPYIEMNLSLGVFKDRRNVSGEQSSSSSDQDMSSASESSSDDSDASSESTDIVTGTSTSKILRPTKPLPTRKKLPPRIDVLNSST